MSDVFDNADLGIDDLFELDRYFDDVFEKNDMEMNKKREDEKFQPLAIQVDERSSSVNDDADWWLEEDAFEMKKEENPFGVKK